MNNKSELFDLKREKRELDDFLSMIEEAEASSPMDDTIQTEAPSGSSAENKSVFEDTQGEISGLELETPAMKEEVSEPITLDGKVLTMEEKTTPESDSLPLELETPALELEGIPEKLTLEEKAVTPGDDQPVSRFDDSFSTPAEPVPEDMKKPSFVSLELEEKVESFPPISEEQDVKTPESFETMTRSDERTKSDEPVLAETHPPEEGEILKKPVPEKKKSKTNAYDFAPEKESAGAGKWIGIGIGMVVILLIALLIGYFWLSSGRGGKTIKIIQSYIPVFATDQATAFPSVQGINLIQIRQKLLYNATLGKNIRVIEGFTENLTPRPVSKIKIAANFYNAEGIVLASTESFAGNIIIDEKLESLDTNGILTALKDVKTMEDRVPPQGQMPFMVVFAGEPAGVFKLSVLPVDVKTH